MDPFYINLGGFIVSSPAQRMLNFLLGVIFLVQGGIAPGESSTMSIVLRSLQAGFGLLLVGMALFPTSYNKPYFLLISEKGIEGRTGYFKQVFFAWEDIRTIDIKALDVSISLKDKSVTTISLAHTPITDIRNAKAQLTQWALQRGVLVQEDGLQA